MAENLIHDNVLNHGIYLATSSRFIGIKILNILSRAKIFFKLILNLRKKMILFRDTNWKNFAFFL